MNDQKKENQLPANEIEILIGPNKYTIKQPTVGQHIEIERAKIRLTDSTHREMLFGTSLATDSYMYVEAIATFSVLIPDLVSKDLNAKSLLELTPLQFKGIKNAYQTIYYPWIQQWRDIYNADVEPKSE